MTYSTSNIKIDLTHTHLIHTLNHRELPIKFLINDGSLLIIHKLYYYSYYYCYHFIL